MVSVTTKLELVFVKRVSSRKIAQREHVLSRMQYVMTQRVVVGVLVQILNVTMKLGNVAASQICHGQNSSFLVIAKRKSVQVRVTKPLRHARAQGTGYAIMTQVNVSARTGSLVILVTSIHLRLQLQ